MRHRYAIAGLAVALCAQLAGSNVAAAQVGCKVCRFDEGVWQCKQSNPGYENCSASGTSCSHGSWCEPMLPPPSDLQADGTLSVQRTFGVTTATVLVLAGSNPRQVPLFEESAVEGRQFRRACNGVVLERRYSVVVGAALKTQTKALVL